MNNIILSRYQFLGEVYSKGNQNELNEGIFDFFKTLMKQEWNGIKSKDANVKKKLEEADKALTGFTVIKMKKSGTCTQIRQALCDFANTLWESKSKELEDGKKLQKMLMGLKDKGEISDEDEDQVKKSGTVSKYMSQFNIKDKALADNLKNYEKKITDLCKGDPDLTRWTNLLKNDIRNIINSLIIDEYDKVAKDSEKEKIKQAKEELKKQQAEEQKKIDKKNKEAQKAQEDAIKEIEKERTDALSNAGVSPIKNQTGDKAFQDLSSNFEKLFNDAGITEGHEYSFSNVINEGLSKKLSNLLGSDNMFGISDIDKITDISDKLVRTILKELKRVFEIVDKVSEQGKLFKETPSDTVQALYVGLSKVISHALTDGVLDDNTKLLLSKCSIDSDKTLGYGIPLIDPKDEKKGNVFTAVVGELTKSKSDVVKDELLAKYTKNMTKMFNEIAKTAQELKDKRQKEDEKKAKQEEE